jgi:hypothetical protein
MMVPQSRDWHWRADTLLHRKRYYFLHFLNSKEYLLTRFLGGDVRCKVGALQYRECSGLTGRGVREVFECAARLAMSGRKSKSKRKKFLDLIGR